MTQLTRVAIGLGALVLVPAALYVASEVRGLSENEALVEVIYDQQLETILFAVNQHAWDVADSWAGTVERRLAEGQPFDTVAATLSATHPSLRALFVADPLAADPLAADAAQAATSGGPPRRASLAPDLLARLQADRSAGYRKLQPVESADPGTMALVFVPEADAYGAPALGMVLDVEAFITEVLGPKLEEVGQGRLLLACFKGDAEDPVYATGAMQRADVQGTLRRLWLLPDYVVGTSLPEGSMASVLQARFRRNLLLIGLLASALLFGVAVVFRGIRREVELARLKGDFVSNVSHELRTPLALIRMYAETLELGRVPTEERRQQYLRIIGQETERLTHLVNNVLNFSSMEAGRKTYQRVPLQLNGQVEAVLEMYTHKLQRQGFTTEVHLAPDLPPVLADAEAVREVVINLIDNAVKYSPDERVLSIATGQTDGHVYAEVADRGIGIEAAELGRIFDKFYRVETGLVHTTKGTGLGLALVQHIVRAHGGQVRVDSTPGEGSRFRLLFPVADVSADRPASAPVAG